MKSKFQKGYMIYFDHNYSRFMNNKIFILYLFFVICFFVPSTAYAYLDPGTGNALIYVALSLLGAVFYFVKGFFYKIIKRKEDGDNKVAADEVNKISQHSIVIFNEGKAYWNTFKPIVEKLLEKKQPFTYYTMDIEDPCLTIANRLMDNRYIGDGNMAYSKIGHLSADVVLSTTPNIGTQGYPIPRSKKIKKLVHVFHAFDDLATYYKGSLDHYDAVLLMGEFEIPLIRKLEELRKLPEKELIPAGLPYMDELLKKAEQSSGVQLNDKDAKQISFDNPETITVLLAPSWGAKGFLTAIGIGFIETLAKQNFNLILRPHPQSLKVEKSLLRNIESKLKQYKNLKWDFNPDGTNSLQEADILISDVSAVRLDFAFVYQKPFITIPIKFSEETLKNFEIADLGFSWTEEAIQEIGYTLKENELEHLDDIIFKVLYERTNENILAFRDKHIYNLGKSGEVITNYLIQSSRFLKELPKNANE